MTGEQWVTILVTGISALATIVSVVITTKANNKEITHQMETSQAVTDTKLQALTDEVRIHNGFARRMPVVEEQVKQLTTRMEHVEKEVAK